MDYTGKIKKVIAIINDNKEITDITIYDIMLWVNTSQYIVAKAVLTALERKGFIKKEGKKWVIVGREYGGDSNDKS